MVAFDLAGAEYDYPAKEHREAFYAVADANMAVTIHAGEAYGPESIHQALHYCNARRIGHGTRLFEDPELMQFVNDFRIPLEICLTSNVQTRAVPSFEAHPLRLYYDQGLVVTLNTDNRLMSAPPSPRSTGGRTSSWSSPGTSSPHCAHGLRERVPAVSGEGRAAGGGGRGDAAAEHSRGRRRGGVSAGARSRSGPATKNDRGAALASSPPSCIEDPSGRSEAVAQRELHLDSSTRAGRS